MFVSKTFAAAALVSLQGAIFAEAGNGCNSDNCYRDAVGTARGLYAARTSACSSAQLCTVTPVASTETVTVTTTQVQQARRGIPSGQLLVPVDKVHKREEPATPVTSCPTETPAFVTACKGAVSTRYQSACSCAGITRSYVTTTASTKTSTVYEAATEAPSETGSFHISVKEEGKPDMSLNGYYLGDRGYTTYVAFGTEGQHGLPVEISKAGLFTFIVYTYTQKVGDNDGTLYLTVPGAVDAGYYAPIKCHVAGAAGSKKLACVGLEPSQTRLQNCPPDGKYSDFHHVLSSELKAGCHDITFSIV